MFEYDHVETQLYNVFFNFLSHFVPYDVIPPLYRYLYFNILNHEQPTFRSPPWPEDLKTVTRMISIEHKNQLIAEDLGLICTYDHAREFFFWKYMGDRFEIVKEMTMALSTSKWKLTDHHKGLKWLIKKLNASRENPMSVQYI